VTVSRSTLQTVLTSTLQASIFRRPTLIVCNPLLLMPDFWLRFSHSEHAP